MAMTPSSPEEVNASYVATEARPRTIGREDSGFDGSPKNTRKNEEKQSSIASVHQSTDPNFEDGNSAEDSGFDGSPKNTRKNEEKQSGITFHQSTDPNFEDGNSADFRTTFTSKGDPEMIPKINGITTDLGEASLDETSLDETSLDETSLDETSLDETSLDETSLDETLDETSLDETSLEEKTSVVSEKTVSALGVSHRERLQTPLDQSLGPLPNWYLLGLKIFKKDPEKTKRLEDLHACYCGGGNKGWRFLEILEKHNETLSCTDFAATAKKLKRDDIYQFINLKSGALKDLGTAERLDLATKLNKRYHGWEYFADIYKFSKDDIHSVKQAVMEPDVYSPTERLLKWFDVEDITLNQLEGCCKSLKFNNVIKIIQDIKQELCNVNSKQKKKNKESQKGVPVVLRTKSAPS